MDFTKIQELHLAHVETLFYERMKFELPGLKHLSLEWANSGSAIPQEWLEFLRSMPPLETLSIHFGGPCAYTEQTPTRTAFPLETILKVHGRTLRNLSFHQAESSNPNSRRMMLSITDISQIEESCPNLSYLGLDLDRDASRGWPNATVNAIMRLKALTSLNIGLEIGEDLHSTHEQSDYDGYAGYNPEGLGGPGPFREPRMSLEVSEVLFAEFRLIKQGRALERVEFTVGDYSEVPYDGPLFATWWVDGRARKFLCEVGRDCRELAPYMLEESVVR
jgi:hypothetical protein